MVNKGRFDRIGVNDAGQGIFKSNARAVSDLFHAVEQSEALDAIAKRWGISPVELVEGLAYVGLEGESGAGLALVQSGPKGDRRDWNALLGETALSKLLPGWKRPARLALAAGLLQIVDAWEESHEAAQQAENLGEKSVSAYWHGIAHRREPDSGNASYWFRRVGRHPVFEPLAEIVQNLLQGQPGLAERIVPKGVWNPLGFIRVADEASPRYESILKQIQGAEIALLLDATFANGG